MSTDLAVEEKGSLHPFDAVAALRLVMLLKEGLRLEVACRAVQVSEPKVRFWRKDNPDFDLQVILAETEVEQEALAQVLGAASGKPAMAVCPDCGQQMEVPQRDWKAAAWFLERRFGWAKSKDQDDPLEGLPEDEVQAVFRQVDAVLREKKITVGTKRRKK